MKKSLENVLEIALKKMEDITNKYFYYSDIVPDMRYKNDKYFIKFCNTHNVYRSFKTQRDLEIFCKTILETNNIPYED